MKTLMLFLMLTPNHTWEFLRIDVAPSANYCRFLALDVERAFTNTPGNMRIICADDARLEA